LFDLMRHADAWPAEHVMREVTGTEKHGIDSGTITGWVEEFLTFIPPALLDAAGGGTAGLQQKFKVILASQKPGKPGALGDWSVIGGHGRLTLYLDAHGMNHPARVKRTTFHELTHWLESVADAPGISTEASGAIMQWIKEARDHFDLRTAGDIHGTIKDDVHTKEGGFYDDYSGRLYKQPTAQELQFMKPGARLAERHGKELAPRHLELLADPAFLLRTLRSIAHESTPAKTIETVRIMYRLLFSKQ
jgi:hypothetical protein